MSVSTRLTFARKSLVAATMAVRKASPSLEDGEHRDVSAERMLDRLEHRRLPGAGTAGEGDPPTQVALLALTPARAVALHEIEALLTPANMRAGECRCRRGMVDA